MAVRIRKKFNKNISSPIWSIASNFASRALTFLFTPIFTRLLSPEEFGIYSLYVSLMGIFTVITTLEISGTVMYRGLAKFGEKSKEIFLSSSLGAILTLNVTSIIIYMIFRTRLNDITALNTRLTLFLFFQVFLNAALGVYFAEKRYGGEYRSVAVFNVGIGILSPILALGLIYLGKGGESRIIAPLVSSAVFTLPVIYNIIRKGKKLFSKEAWGFLFRISLPMLPHYLALSVIAQSDKIIIAKMLGEGALGKYSAAYSVGFLISLLTGGLLLVISPIIIRKQKERKNEEVKTAILTSGRLIAFFTLAFLTVVPEIFYLFVSGEYYGAMPVVYPTALSVVLLFLSNSASTCLIHYEKPHLISKNTLTVGGVSIFLNFILIKSIGFIGGALVTLASYFMLYTLNKRTLLRVSDNTLSINYGFPFWFVFLSYSMLVFLFRFSFLSRLLLLFALLLIFLPEAKKYKKLIFA